MPANFDDSVNTLEEHTKYATETNRIIPETHLEVIQEKPEQPDKSSTKETTSEMAKSWGEVVNTNYQNSLLSDKNVPEWV